MKLDYIPSPLGLSHNQIPLTRLRKNQVYLSFPLRQKQAASEFSGPEYLAPVPTFLSARSYPGYPRDKCSYGPLDAANTTTACSTQII